MASNHINKRAKKSKKTPQSRSIQVISWLVVVLALSSLQKDDQRMYDYVFQSEDGNHIIRLDSKSKFFNTAYLNKTSEVDENSKEKSPQLTTSIRFDRFLKESEIPQECKEWLGDQSSGEFNLIQYNKEEKNCRGVNFQTNSPKQLDCGMAKQSCLLIFETPIGDNASKKQKKLYYIDELNFHLRQDENENNVGLINYETFDEKRLKQYHNVDHAASARNVEYRFLLDPKDYFVVDNLRRFSIKIADPSKHHTLILDDQSYIVRHPLIKKRDPKSGVSFSFNFQSLLEPDQIPDSRNGACRNYTQVRANYMFETPHHCVYGLLNHMSKIHYHPGNEPNSPIKYPYVSIVANSFSQDHFFHIELVGKEVLGRELYHFSRMNLKKGGGKMLVYDTLQLRFEPAEYGIRHKEQHEHYIQFLHGLLILVIPAFFLITFNKDYHKHGIYFLQFGIMFNFFSQISLSIIEFYDCDGKFWVVYPLIILTLLISFALSLRKIVQIVMIWKIFTLIDYVLMSLLMGQGHTFLYAIINVAVYQILAFCLKMAKKEVRFMEVSISFVTSLCLHNSLGNILYYTTALNRVIFFMERLSLHDRNPELYYLGYGIICSLVSFARLFLTDYLPWNLEARRKHLSVYDPEFGVQKRAEKEVELSDNIMEDSGKADGEDEKDGDKDKKEEDGGAGGVEGDSESQSDVDTTLDLVDLDNSWY